MHMHGMGHTSGGIDEDAVDRVYDHQVVSRLFHYLRPYKRLILVTTLTMLLYSGSVVAIPWLIKWGIDTFIATRDLSGLNTIALAFAIVIVVGYITQYIHLVTLARVGQGVLYGLRTDLFNHIQRLSLSFFDRNEVGRVMSRVQNDVQQLQEFLSIVVLSLGDTLILIGIVVAMMVMNAKLAIITLTVIPLLFVIMVVWQRYARPSFLRVRRAMAMVNAGLQENISGVRVVQSFNREDVNSRSFDSVNDEHLRANLRASRLSAALLPTVDLLTALSLAFVVVFGGSMVLNGTLAVGALVAFALYIQRFFDPVRNLTMQYTELQRAMTSGARIFEMMDVQPEVRDRAGAIDLPPIRGEVRFERVGFHYATGIPVLRDVTLHVQAGQTVALVGHTGAGKTTLVSLLARFYDVTEGRITVDGYDIRDVTRTSLGQQMSMVLQEPFLFSGTVMENLRYNHPRATEEDVARAAQAVGAHDFIMRLKQGYETVLQERGANLSVGQRQLLSFARALAADPRILILDEATANVDSYTENLIHQALSNLLENRTALVIAHRLSTIRSADLIVVFDQGQVVEMGTHRELLQKAGHYAELYHSSISV